MNETINTSNLTGDNMTKPEDVNKNDSNESNGVPVSLLGETLLSEKECQRNANALKKLRDEKTQS